MPVAPPTAGVSLGDIYSKTVQLVNENKISTKNAFDLNLIDHIDDIVDSFMGGQKRKTNEKKDKGEARKSVAGGERRQSTSGPAAGETVEEHRFHEASCTIEASARIYACRVDCVHTDTYRVLGGLSSTDMGEDEGGEDGKGGDKKRRRMVGVNTLERNEASIMQSNIEADEQSDPMFRRMAAAFDAGGAKGLLLSHLPMAEDLSLLFNTNVPLTRAVGTANEIFADPKQLRVSQLGFGVDAAKARDKISRTQLVPGQLDAFRKMLWGKETTSAAVKLPQPLENLLEDVVPAEGGFDGGVPGVPGMPSIPEGVPPLDDAGCADLDGPPSEDLGMGDEAPMEQPAAAGAPASFAPPGGPSLPLMDVMEARPGVGGAGATQQKGDDDAFDELFQKFWAGGNSNQFAYFDEAWAKQKPGLGAIADAEQEPSAEGALVAADGVEKAREKHKRPLFDLSGLARPAKPIETEPVHKHQLSERAAHWQLHRDVPPYMIDRITMPSWPTWSKCDFACLGLRPHLMLKLVRKPTPEGEGPHSFSELFSTVVVENPEAFPWLATDAQAGANAAGRYNGDEGIAPGDADMGDDNEDDFNGNGLPAHLDVDPNELFLRADDKVVPGCDGDGGDFGFAGDMGGDDGDDAFMTGVDFDLADKPDTVGKVDIGYSRNSKFVDVKLVKKHLWDCISEDMEDAKAFGDGRKFKSSFQELVRRTVKRLPKTEIENLSVAVCFICALHLCNEKGVEMNFTEGEMGDFAMTSGPPVNPTQTDIAPPKEKRTRAPKDSKAKA